MVKRIKSGLTKSTKRKSYRSATSALKEWQPKVSPGPFRDSKRPGQGVRFPQPNKPYP